MQKQPKQPRRPLSENENGRFLCAKDGGGHEVYETNALRESAIGKGRFDLVAPEAIQRLAWVCERGAAKYSARNWELGIPLSRYLDAAERHLQQYKLGLRDEDHLGAAFWNLMALIATEARVRRGTLDRKLYDLPWRDSTDMDSEE